MLYLEYFWWICVRMILINKLGFPILWTHCECVLSISPIFDGKPEKEMFEYEHFNVLCTSNTLHLLNHHPTVGCICFGATINRCVLKSQNFFARSQQCYLCIFKHNVFFLAPSEIELKFFWAQKEWNQRNLALKYHTQKKRNM